MSNVVSQLYEDSESFLFPAEKEIRTRIRRTHRRRSSRAATTTTNNNNNALIDRTAPRPDSLSKQVSRRNHFNRPDEPVMSTWEGLQSPLGPNMGLEDEVTELRRRASAAAGKESSAHSS